MDNKSISLYSFIMSIIIIIYAIYKNAYINNKLTCKKYVLNTYLYIILSLLVVSTIVLLIDTNFNEVIKNILLSRNYSFMILFIFTIISLISTMFISPERTILKHISWIIFIILIGITLYPIYKITELSSALSTTLFTTTLIVIILSIIAFYKPELISLSWGPILLVLLFAGIILKFGLYLFTKSSKSNSKLSLILSYGFIVLFSFLLLYDTKKVQLNALKCKIPNYINESLGIFLDIINLFSNISRVKVNQ